VYARLEREAVETLARDGIDPVRCRTVREADLRYAGQSMEVRVIAPAGPVDHAFATKLLDTFHAAHHKAFGYDYRGRQKVELVNFCVSGFGVIERPTLPKLDSRPGVTPARKGARRVFFDGQWLDTPVYDRAALAAGFRLDGPAVVEEFGSTTVVWPGQWLEVDPHGIMLVREKVTALKQ
jgi:N-methylhydantoinase A